jgi:hypothetical protein
MNETLIRQRLQQWLVDFVEKPNPLLNNWPPCPYARQARLDNKIHIVFDSPLRIADYVSHLDTNDVVVLCFDHAEFTATQIELFTKHINSILLFKDCVVLEDHPGTEELINGVKMNFGECGLMVLQRLTKLNAAAEQLQKKGYYDTWSKENLDDVVNWRYIN